MAEHNNIKETRLSKRVFFKIDLAKWVLPISVLIDCVGNNNRIWTIKIGILCFHFRIDVDDDALLMDTGEFWDGMD